MGGEERAGGRLCGAGPRGGAGEAQGTPTSGGSPLAEIWGGTCATIRASL